MNRIMVPKRSSGHVGSAGVKFTLQSQQPQQQPSQLELPPPQQELQETVFRPPKQKTKKLKFQRE